MPPFENWPGFEAIDPPLPKWEPNPDPMAIEIPGLDTEASINDQIDQMDQLITIKLQVSIRQVSRMPAYADMV
jgi:hypothetical protein